MTKRKRLDLCNPNPIYEKELNKLDVHQVKGRWNVSRTGKEAKDVGISNSSMARCTSPLSRARGVRKVSENSDGVADGSLMFPEVLRPASGEGISARLAPPVWIVFTFSRLENWVNVS